MLTPSHPPLAFDKIRALGSHHLGASVGGEEQLFEVPVHHVCDGRQPSETAIQVRVANSAYISIRDDRPEYVRRYVERLGNRFPNDGFKLKNLKFYEPIEINSDCLVD
jgi:hypothetical protein